MGSFSLLFYICAHIRIHDTVPIGSLPFPEPEQVARGDSAHICLLLQLILGAAVNCDRKNDFIANLMQLDEIDQAELMSFIQDLVFSSQ